MRHLMITAFAGSSLFAVLATPVLADYRLDILHINDFHARVEPVNTFNATCSSREIADKACFGGVARIKSAVDAERKRIASEGGNVLVLDAGDEFQGSLFFTTYKGLDSAEFMNAIGFDAMALGNHEFDLGAEGLAPFLDKVTFPVLASNVTTTDTSPIHDKFKPYIVKQIGGKKIGIIGAITVDTPEISKPGPTVTFSDDIDAIQTSVDALKAQGVDKIIALTHTGYQRDQKIAATVEGLDVIVGGHSHTLLSSSDPAASGPYPTLVKNPAGQDVPIVTAYAYSKYLGHLTLTFDDDGKLKSAEGAPILLDASITQDAAMAARVAEMAKPIESLKTKVVASTEAPIDGSAEICRKTECAMGNLVADAMLDRVKDQGINFAIINGGVLRASIPKGNITMGTVLTVLPFQNTVATLLLRGGDVIAALENGVSRVDEGAGRFPQVSGLKYAFDATKPVGSRISDVMVRDEQGGWQPINTEFNYGVVTNDYARAGGDGYTVFAQKGRNAYDHGPGLDDVVIDYLQGHKPYKPYTDGRIQEVRKVDAVPLEPVADTSSVNTVIAQPPSIAPDKTTEAKSTVYHIRRGDTFWDLAVKFYGDGEAWQRLRKANLTFPANKLPVGEPLNVPVP